MNSKQKLRLSNYDNWPIWLAVNKTHTLELRKFRIYESLESTSWSVYGFICTLWHTLQIFFTVSNPSFFCSNESITSLHTCSIVQYYVFLNSVWYYFQIWVKTLKTIKKLKYILCRSQWIAGKLCLKGVVISLRFNSQTHREVWGAQSRCRTPGVFL